MSELMLQQTQVDRVVPKYGAWIKAFPSWKRLANASTHTLITHWAGLGYNRRALYARDAALDVISHGIPTSEVGWRRLKGVGPYMAAALTEFVNHVRTIVIDTNVRRVAGRALLGIRFPERADDASISRALRRAIPECNAHWDVPQALMDIGSAICLSQRPRCDVCPLKNVCRAREQFLPKHLEKTLRHLARYRARTRVVESRHVNKKYPDRMYRGRILAWVRTRGRARIETLGPNIDETYDPIADLDWIRAMVQRLMKDGLLMLRPDGLLALPFEPPQ